MRMVKVTVLCVIMVAGCAREGPPFDKAQLSFFVTSRPVGTGSGNLGGLDGADAHCQALAKAVGSTRQWRAYLSATSADGSPIHARDRIGKGPWVNANGKVVANSLQELHGSPGPPQDARSYHENGKRVGQPHDILTGSNPDGTLANGDFTCRNWTSTAGKTWLGHSNRIGSCCGDRNTSWNSAHESQGCSSGGLAAMGGASYFYCFAVN
jgi:hypothetical protein